MKMVVIVTLLQTYLHQSASVVTAIKCLFILLVVHVLQASVPIMQCSLGELIRWAEHRTPEIILTWSNADCPRLTISLGGTLILFGHCGAART